MENSSVEVDDAVATIIANVNFGEFHEVAGGNFTEVKDEEAETPKNDEEDTKATNEGDDLPCEEEEERAEEGQDNNPPEESARPKKQRKQRQTRTSEDGDYPNIKSWKPYINSVLDAGIRGYHHTPIPTYEKDCPKVEDYLKPDLIIWDLQKFCPELDGKECVNENCTKKMALYPIGYTYMMRILYDFEKPVLLVTSMIRCKNAKEHRFLGYDPRILKLCTDQENAPFVLFHKVGMTRQLFDSIMNQVSNGVKFGQIQDMLRKNYNHDYEKKRQSYAQAVAQYRQNNPDSSTSEKFPAIKVKGPRNTFISQCFLLGFKEKEYFYKLSMSQLLADEWIKVSADFKLPTNVGTNAKGVWIKEKDHIFYCQNEVGQVLTWQLTSSGTFSEIKDTLVSIKDRHEQIGKQLKGCCTGLCCEWTKDLVKVFGPDFQVKSDVDMAVCKLGSKLQDESFLYTPCLDDFQLVFQDPVDSNKIRILPTPPPVTILSNLEAFKEKWRKVKEENGKLVLTTMALHTIAEIETHVARGCYSGIPPFPNSIDQKDFQTNFKRKVNNCRLGIPVMVAIASIALHEHNSARQEDLGRDTAPVLLVVPDEDKAANQEVSGSVSIGNNNLQCLTVEVNMNRALESIASSQAKAVKCAEEVDSKSLLESVNEYLSGNKKDSVDPVEHNYPTKAQYLEEIIIKKTLTFLKYYEMIVKTAPESYANDKLIPFLTCAFPLLLQQKGQSKDLHREVINEKIHEFANLTVIWEEGDLETASEEIKVEDRFFHAIAVILQSYLARSIIYDKRESGFKSFQGFLNSLGFEIGMQAGKIEEILRDQIKNKEKTVAKENGQNAKEGGVGKEEKAEAVSELCETKTQDEDEPKGVDKVDEIRKGEIMEKDVNGSLKDPAYEEGSKGFDKGDKEGKKETEKKDNESFVKNLVNDEGVESNKDTGNQKQVSEDGEFEILVRDTASLLSAHISIISGLKNFPIIPIFPQKLATWSPDLFLVYESGQFFPVISQQVLSTIVKQTDIADRENEETRTELANVRCRCGRGNHSGTGGKCYTHEHSKYITRCQCFRAQQPCTNKCDCQRCANPYGDRPGKKRQNVDADGDESIEAPAAKRKRHSHHHASLSKGLRAENFKTGAGLEVSLGKWSSAEKFLFEALISELKTEEESLTTEIVAQKFNNIVQVASLINGLQNLVGFKTPTQVNERLKEREKDVETYLMMYQAQLDLLIVKEENCEAEEHPWEEVDSQPVISEEQMVVAVEEHPMSKMEETSIVEDIQTDVSVA